MSVTNEDLVDRDDAPPGWRRNEAGKWERIQPPEPVAKRPASLEETHGIVQPGDSLRTFAERHGVDHNRIIELNRDLLSEHARARGFDAHTFTRLVPNEDGGAWHNGVQVRQEPDAHVFSGQVLRLREDEG